MLSCRTEYATAMPNRKSSHFIGKFTASRHVQATVSTGEGIRIVIFLLRDDLPIFAAIVFIDRRLQRS